MSPEESVADFISSSKSFCVVKAPPGSGKTELLVNTIPLWTKNGKDVLVAALTNDQVNDICTRLATKNPDTEIVRFSSSSYEPEYEFPPNVLIIKNTKEIQQTCKIVVATVAKLSLVGSFRRFEVLYIDEAWQVSFGDTLPILRFANRLVMIGDPGQIEPVRSIDHTRWETSPYPPGYAAPTPYLLEEPLNHLTYKIELDTCQRLPYDSVKLVQYFYDFPFAAAAQPGERYLKSKSSETEDGLDRAFASLDKVSTTILSIATDKNGIGIDLDIEIASLTANVANRLVAQTQSISTSSSETSLGRSLLPSDIGIVATHRNMNAAIRNLINPAYLQSGLKVDTPERWQGQQRAVMIAVHPLSGVIHPSSFDLDTGRLCVMASRHRSALLIVSRDHVPTTLDHHVPQATQSPGLPDQVGSGHAAHKLFWDFHVKNERVFYASLA